MATSPVEYAIENGPNLDQLVDAFKLPQSEDGVGITFAVVRKDTGEHSVLRPTCVLSLERVMGTWLRVLIGTPAVHLPASPFYDTVTIGYDPYLREGYYQFGTK